MKIIATCTALILANLSGIISSHASQDTVDDSRVIFQSLASVLRSHHSTGVIFYRGAECIVDGGYPTFSRASTIINSDLAGFIRTSMANEHDGARDKVYHMYFDAPVIDINSVKIRSIDFDEVSRKSPAFALMMIQHSKEFSDAFNKLSMKNSSYLYKSLIPMGENYKIPSSMHNITAMNAMDNIAKAFNVMVIYSECGNNYNINYWSLDN